MFEGFFVNILKYKFTFRKESRFFPIVTIPSLLRKVTSADLTMFLIVKRSVSRPIGTLRMIFIVKRGRMASLGGKRGF
ncbi:hypothetical protein J2Z66_005899 [Paenibacillus eucommiae]|uniref:Uncharacterized protein n=1 Tax=Paenibacillus eucommiae TaxID=1355755 RepID=A0ABS4J381_9BACL|nr:hypothetical protein [Paenibacillus eucommiae]